MNDKRRFHQRLEEFNLSDPAAKLEYNRRLFSPVAEVYPLVTKILSFGRDAAWKRTLIRSLPRQGAAAILDLACGPGDLTFPLSDRYPQAQIAGIDLNPAMLERARANLEAAPASLKDRVTFSEGDMNALGFADASFDLITGGYALRNSPDLKREILSAVINALDAHTEMSTQAINSEDVQRGLKEILLGPAKLYETLRGQA